MSAAAQSGDQTNRTIDVREFASFVASTRSGSRPGISMVAINLRPLEVNLEIQLVRDALIERIHMWCKKEGAQFFNVDSRALFIVPEQTEGMLLRASSSVRTTVTYLVGPHLDKISMELGELVQVFHTSRDIHELSDFLSTYVRVPKIFDSPIARGGSLEASHVADLHKRILDGGPNTFVREFGRNQPLARLNEEGRPKIVGAEHFIAVKQLRHMLLPDVEFAGGQSDFDRLGRVLDWAILEAIRVEDTSLFGHLTVNLTVETFISDDFFDYAKDFADKTKDLELWAEVPIEQCLDNFEAFRERQRELRGFRVFTMADNVKPAMLERMEKTDLDFEGFKFPASPDDPTLDSLIPSLRRLHARHAPTVVTRIEQKEQLMAANECRVRHVQGYLIDRMLAQLGEVG